MTKTTAEWRITDDQVIEQFRAKQGALERQYPVILVTTTGRKTGRALITPLNFSEDGDRLAVIASAGGSETHPAWYLNLQANPEVTIEHGSETFRARAYTAAEPERTRLFDAQIRLMPFFGTYRREVKMREIPVVVFERIGDGEG